MPCLPMIQQRSARLADCDLWLQRAKQVEAAQYSWTDACVVGGQLAGGVLADFSSKMLFESCYPTIFLHSSIAAAQSKEWYTPHA